MSKQSEAYQVGWTDGFCQKGFRCPWGGNHPLYRELSESYRQGFQDGHAVFHGEPPHEVIVMGDLCLEAFGRQAG